MKEQDQPASTAKAAEADNEIARRYAGLVQRLVLDKASYNETNNYTSLTFKIFVDGDVRDMLTTECTGGYPQCNGKGNCGGMWCPTRRLTDALVDRVVQQMSESDKNEGDDD